MAKQSAESKGECSSFEFAGELSSRDLGFSDAGERQTKVRLAIAINDVLKRRGLSQGKAAELVEAINQPKVVGSLKHTG